MVFLFLKRMSMKPVIFGMPEGLLQMWAVLFRGVTLKRDAAMQCACSRKLASCCIMLVLLMATSAASRAEDIAVIFRSQIPDVEQQLIEGSANFYGLSLRTVDLGTPEGQSAVRQELQNQHLRGVLIASDALPLLRMNDTLRAIHAGRKDGIPIFIFGIGPESQTDLFSWSNRTVRNCASLPSSYTPDQLRFGNLKELTGILSGTQLPAVTVPQCSLEINNAGSVQTVLTAGSQETSAPILLRTQLGSTEVFWAPKLRSLDLSWMAEPLATAKAFSYLAPFLLFVKHAAGEYGWHSGYADANLTIDDPWLVEPYGHLNYALLLEEMEKHNFHTTIAFIPWNYSRSHDDVVKLFRSHLDRFSICIHGNDHSHQEFAGAEGGLSEEQSVKARQAIARMEKFHALTGIPYDRFMVFPHSVPAETTFTVLHRYDFLGTANSIHVPAGQPFPKDPVFLLRPYTIQYGNLLSMFRYSAEVPVSKSDIAVQVFLNNPVLFYGHQQLFARGATAFNEIADYVNSLQPSMHWGSLGDIARHSYLLRKRSEGAYDVRMLANEIELQNLTGHDAVEFHIRRSENPTQKGIVAEVNGKPVAFDWTENNNVSFRVIVNPGESEVVRIQYPNDLVLAKERLDGSGARVWALRHISDFRDITLSRSSLGSRFVSTYYGHGWNLIEERWETRLIALIAICFVTMSVLIVRRKLRHNRSLTSHTKAASSDS